jgi:hypothetical protein
MITLVKSFILETRRQRELRLGGMETIEMLNDSGKNFGQNRPESLPGPIHQNFFSLRK